MLWATSSWEFSGPAVHEDATVTCTAYLIIAAEQAHPFTETVFPNGGGFCQQDNAICHAAKMSQKRFEGHNNEFKM